MSIASKPGISEDLFQLIIHALEQALENVQSCGEAFNPFVLFEGGKAPALCRLVAPDPKEAVKAGRVLE